MELLCVKHEEILTDG